MILKRVAQQALACAASNRFLHWELAFPTVFSATPPPTLPLSGEGMTTPPLTRGGWEGIGFGGLDAVIGNPPWNRMKLQKVEWFAERKTEIAKAARAADRKKLIVQLEANSDPLWQDYLAAQAAAETGSGVAGLLCPSVIAADKNASEFFRTLTTPSPQPLPREGGGAFAPLSLDGRGAGGENAAANFSPELSPMNRSKSGHAFVPTRFFVSRTAWANDEAVYPSYKKLEVHG